MARQKLLFDLDEDVLRELLFLAKDVGRLEDIINVVGQTSETLDFEKTVDLVAERFEMSTDDVERLLLTVYNITRTMMRVKIDVPQFLETATDSFEDRKGESFTDSDLQQWSGALDAIRQAISRVGPDHPLVVTVASATEGDQPAHSDWMRERLISRPISWSSDEEWLAERAKQALLMLRDCVEVNTGKHGGVPVLRGTRFPIASVFAEMSEGLGINEIAADFDLDKDMLKQLLEALAIHLDRPVTK